MDWYAPFGQTEWIDGSLAFRWSWISVPVWVRRSGASFIWSSTQPRRLNIWASLQCMEHDQAINKFMFYLYTGGIRDDNHVGRISVLDLKVKPQSFIFRTRVRQLSFRWCRSSIPPPFRSYLQVLIIDNMETTQIFEYMQSYLNRTIFWPYYYLAGRQSIAFNSNK